MKAAILQIVTRILDPSIELVDLIISGGKKLHIQVLLDKETGISMDELTLYNRKLSTLLDEADLVPGAYMLEVSSAGLERPLNKPEHYIRFQTRKVKLVLENKKTLTGIIKKADEHQVLIEDKTGVTTVPYTEIVKANLIFEF